MKVHHYFAIGLKLFSVALFVYGLRFTVPIVQMTNNDNFNGFDLSVSVLMIELLICWLMASILWLFPITIAKLFLKPGLDKEVEPLSKPSILAVFIVAIGLYIFAFGVIDILFWGVYINLALENSNFVLDPESKANVVVTAFQLGFGIFLIYKCRTISDYINKIAR